MSYGMEFNMEYNICRFYPYLSMLFRFSITLSVTLFTLLTVRPLNQNTTDAQRCASVVFWFSGLTVRSINN